MGIGFFGTKTGRLHFDEFSLSELGIVINIEFSVNTEEFVVGAEGPRVDLELDQVQGAEHAVQVLKLLFGLISDLIQFQSRNHFVQLSFGQSYAGFDHLNHNIFFRH
jgi:hypothetical protein